jgi:hypothetical protein
MEVIYMAITPKPSGNVVDSFSGSTGQTHTKSSGYWKSLSIVNDGNSDLTFTVNNITITVKSNETFTDDFSDFNQITVNSNIAYRIVARQ